MWYVLVYWIVAGFALYMLPSEGNRYHHPLAILGMCMLLGGIIIPARLIAKAVY